MNYNRYEREVLAAFPKVRELSGLKSGSDRDRFLIELQESDFLREYLNFLLNQVAEDSNFIPPGSDGAIAILADSGLALVLRSYDPAKLRQTVTGANPILHSQNADVAMILVSKDPVGFAHYQYHYDPSKDMLTNFRTIALSDKEDMLLNQGDIFYSKSNHSVGDYSRIDKKATFLAISVASDFKYTFAFDKKSGLPMQIIAATNEDTRIEYISQIFAELNAPEAVPQMVQLLKKVSGFGRWRLARDILKLDHNAGVQIIANMAKHDDDAQVRNAAQKSLKLLGWAGT